MSEPDEADELIIPLFFTEDEHGIHLDYEFRGVRVEVGGEHSNHPVYTMAHAIWELGSEVEWESARQHGLGHDAKNAGDAE